jgi:nitrogen regulatory protein P-II 1
MTQESKSLIVSIVKKGHGDDVIDASMEAGARGGTLIFGRGIGPREKKKILGVAIEPEKEIVFTIVSTDIVEYVMDAIIQAVRLAEPGQGVVFSLVLDKIAGISQEVLQELEEGSEGASTEAEQSDDAECVSADTEKVADDTECVSTDTEKVADDTECVSTDAEKPDETCD